MAIPARVARRRGWAAPAADLLVVAVAALSTTLMREPVKPAVLTLIAIIWPLLLVATRGYHDHGFGRSARARLVAVARAGGLLGLGFFVVSTISPRSADAGQLLLLAVLVTVGSAGLRVAPSLGRRVALLNSVERRTRVVVAGSAYEVHHLLAELRRSRRQHVEVVGVCVTTPALPSEPVFEVPTRHGIEDIASAVEATGARAVIALPDASLDARAVRRVGWALESIGAELYVGTPLLDVHRSRASLDNVGGVGVVHVRAIARSSTATRVKAFLEWTVAIATIVVLAPIMLAIMLGVRLDSRGPAIFRQERVGQQGRIFTMFKFRTMSTDAEEVLETLQRDAGSDTMLFKLAVDPRVTRLGSYLRRSSLDELPQLFNIALGQMALVGPRPALQREVQQYEDDAMRRLAVKPGLTGLWQVSGRSDLSWEDSVRLDLLYVDNWSLGLDLALIFRTVGAVLRRRGAY